MTKLGCVFLTVFLAGSAIPACASSDAAWNDLAREAKRACIVKSDLKDAKIDGKITGFEGHVVATVKGEWKPKYMKGAKATFLCLYDKRTKKAETSELGQFP
ncbi:MAG: hypothetical protein K8R18_07950 [Parvibaculum sp.]|uniref:hypothetical protein n=1 Tax=Parvibaculum sp. TaxID=2024848 RepID=UPI0025E4F2D1|nr:hypothetical protein [Parvibaculum sp.]MCE9649541.1 hypothetical protein [Parvibaculum sp.]